MALFKTWCASEREETGRKRYWALVEKAGGRDAIRHTLGETNRMARVAWALMAKGGIYRDPAVAAA